MYEKEYESDLQGYPISVSKEARAKAGLFR